MIAIQKIGKSFMGALRYNLKKLDARDPLKRAELLDTNFTDRRLASIKAEVDLLRQLRPNLNRYTYHTSLNFPAEDAGRLDNKMLTEIAHEYLEAMGFNSNQFLIFRHHDAGHPHLHLLVNRICFDGSLVSDSNNYIKSESAIRVIEERYSLVAVEPSNKAAVRSPTKNEVELAVRKHKASDKIVLQMILNELLEKRLTLQELLVKGEQAGVHFLFNQASTGRVSGVTYFFKDFKAKGQSLGNRYKWSELVKAINYDQERDKHAITDANRRTTERYNLISKDQQGYITENEMGDNLYDTVLLKQGENIAAEANEAVNSTSVISVGISDDINDEAVLGKNRRKRGKAGRVGR